MTQKLPQLPSASTGSAEQEAVKIETQSDDIIPGIVVWKNVPTEDIGVPSQLASYEGPYAKSGWELLDKMFISRIKGNIPIVYILILVLWVITIAVTFYQDNGSGILGNWDGIKWFLKKIGIISLFFLFAEFSYWIIRKIKPLK